MLFSSTCATGVAEAVMEEKSGMRKMANLDNLNSLLYILLVLASVWWEGGGESVFHISTKRLFSCWGTKIQREFLIAVWKYK